MKAKPRVLQPRQQRPDHQPDQALDALITQHQRKLNARLHMLAPTTQARAHLARHMINRMTNHRGFRS